MMGKTFSERYAAKLAHFRAFDRFPYGRVNREYDKQRKKVGDRKRRNLEARRKARRKERELREETRYVLRVARAVLGYKKMGPKKMTVKHLKALAKGRRRYWQSKHKTQGVKHGR
jgi:hypothetical protein